MNMPTEVALQSPQGALVRGRYGEGISAAVRKTVRFFGEDRLNQWAG
jgi:hypothetical protein